MSSLAGTFGVASNSRELLTDPNWTRSELLHSAAALWTTNEHPVLGSWYWRLEAGFSGDQSRETTGQKSK